MTTATLSWSAVTHNTDGSLITGAVTYDVYQGDTVTSLARVQSGITGLTAQVTTGFTPGTNEVFAVSAVVGTSESATSAPFSVAIPALVPLAPTGLTVTLS